MASPDPPNCFVAAGGRNGITQIAISPADHEAQSRASPQKGVTVLLLHLRDVLVVAEHPVQEPWLNRPSGGSFTAGT